jgi:hypothetical protein
MKKIKFIFLILLVLPTFVQAQYTGGNGRGDVSSQYFGSALIVNSINPEMPFNIYSSGNSVFVDNKSNALLTGEVIVYNMIGQPIMRKQLSENPLTRISLNESNGCFFVKVNFGNKTYSQKISLIGY